MRTPAARIVRLAWDVNAGGMVVLVSVSVGRQNCQECARGWLRAQTGCPAQYHKQMAQATTQASRLRKANHRRKRGTSKAADKRNAHSSTGRLTATHASQLECQRGRHSGTIQGQRESTELPGKCTRAAQVSVTVSENHQHPTYA